MPSTVLATLHTELCLCRAWCRAWWPFLSLTFCPQASPTAATHHTHPTLQAHSSTQPSRTCHALPRSGPPPSAARRRRRPSAAPLTPGTAAATACARLYCWPRQPGSGTFGGGRGYKGARGYATVGDPSQQQDQRQQDTRQRQRKQWVNRAASAAASMAATGSAAKVELAVGQQSIINIRTGVGTFS